MSSTIAPGTSVPDAHLVTTIPGSNGTTYWLYGFHAFDGTARFTLIHDGAANGDGFDVILDNVPWPTAYRRLVAMLHASKVEAFLRTVLPPL